MTLGNSIGDIAGDMLSILLLPSDIASSLHDLNPQIVNLNKHSDAQGRAIHSGNPRSALIDNQLSLGSQRFQRAMGRLRAQMAQEGS